MVAKGPTPARPPALAEATKNSTIAWQGDLQSLFDHARERFPDVLWELVDESSGSNEEVWGHKAIVYARAPPSFQARYFSFKPPPAASPLPYSTSPATSGAAQSMFSLSLAVDSPTRSPSPYGGASPTPSATSGTPIIITTSMSPVLFSKELGYLYTGKGFGDAFEFLFDLSKKPDEVDTDDSRLDKLRKDLVFMWRSRLYSDVRISLTNELSEHEETTAVFSSHRFVLVSRSPYFYAQLISFGITPTPTAPLTLSLPSPPFTPASLHFTLGFIYTGTLNFSNRTFDLDTAFHIMRSATYLSLQSLYEEIQARIVQEMTHGLFHAFLEFSEYERITGGKWGTGGCRCRQCARRAPRVLEFAISDDVKNPFLEKGARRALVGLFGEGWCNFEFASLPQKTKDGLLKGLVKRTTPLNIFPLLFAAQQALRKLNSVRDGWVDGVREMVHSARKTIDDVLSGQSEVCFEQGEWMAMMDADAGHFEDGEKVEWVMDAIRRGLAEKNAGIVYQTLVSSILIRPHSTEAGQTLLSSTSHIRIQVEQLRSDVLRWLRRRWIGTHQENGFDLLEGWALKEISHEIDVPVEDLLSSSYPVPRSPVARPGLRQSSSKTDEADTSNAHSLRTGVLSRNMAKQSLNVPGRQQLMSSASSVHPSARSTFSTATRSTIGTAGPFVRRKAADAESRQDSKITLNQSAVMDPPQSYAASVVNVGPRSPDSSSVMLRVPARRTNEATTRPKSSASSVTSVHSHASTVRKPSGGVGLPALRASLNSSRPSSAISSRSDASTAFKTAPDSVSQSRRESTASAVSVRSVKAQEPRMPQVTRQRKTSATAISTSLIVSKAKRVGSTAGDVSPNGPGPSLLSPPAKRSISAVSVRSVASTVSLPSKKVTSMTRKIATESNQPSSTQAGRGQRDEVPDICMSIGGSSITIKGKAQEEGISYSDKASSVKSDSPSTRTTRRKASNDTITLSLHGLTAKQTESVQPAPLSPNGATLDIGIPCIVTSKRKRFRAFARYIGEVEGEFGPWVGVEVPVGESWADERSDAPQWNDGTWGGIRYFDVGARSEWGDDDWALRRRRMGTDWVNGQKGTKREGDQLNIDRSKRLRSVSPAVSDVSSAEYRGLFVRPQQVLYVVDAVGTDF